MCLNSKDIFLTQFLQSAVMSFQGAFKIEQQSDESFD